MQNNNEEIGNIEYELKGLKSDKVLNKFLTDSYKKSVANSLINGELGNDMMDTISGKKRIKISRFKLIKYKIQKIIDIIYKTF